MLTDAGKAGAAGLVILWDAPTDQLRGYWDPHSGTPYLLPAVFVGSDRAEEVRTLAAAGSEADVIVRAAWDKAPTRNLIATLPGGSRPRHTVHPTHQCLDWVPQHRAEEHRVGKEGATTRQNR